MSDYRALVANLYQQHFGELSRFLTRHVGCRDLAADLLHELFLRLLASEDKVSNIRHQRGFLFRCARNLATEAASSPRWRETGRQDDMPDPAQGADWLCPERQADDKQTLDRLLDAVVGLPPRCREVFILHKFDGLSYPEVAERLNISTSAVEKHMMRALDECRSIVASPEPAARRTGK